VSVADGIEVGDRASEREGVYASCSYSMQKLNDESLQQSFCFHASYDSFQFLLRSSILHFELSQFTLDKINLFLYMYHASFVCFVM
jgi:hypothetical protein